MKIKLLIAAEEHLESIYIYLSLKSENAAINFYNDILDEIESLEDFPYIGQIEPILLEEPEEFRSLIVKNSYKVIYYVDNDSIYIVAVWDCRQNPKTNRTKVKTT